MNPSSEITPREARLDNGQRFTMLPAVDVYEDEAAVLLEADMPGASAESVRVHLDQGYLVLEARRAGGAEGAALLSEFRPVDFRRRFQLPDAVDAGGIDAHFKDGVLRVRLPKADRVRQRTIDVKVH